MKRTSILLFVCLLCLNVFSQDLTPKDWPHLKGYWKFQNVKDLTKATVGNRLTLVGKHQQITGPAYGDTAIRIGIGSYYKCAHGMAPNGGGDSVNRYTLMFDFKVLNFNRWHTFFQTDSANSNDGECFIRPNTGSKPARIGVAATSYTNDSINAKQWYRLVISVNLNNFYRYYINGKLWLDGDTQQIDKRFALVPNILFFADDNQEDDTIDIASVAVFDTCLSSKDIAKIGSIEPCVANPPRINLGRDTTLCADQTINLDGGTNFITHNWSTGNKMPFQLIDAGTLGLGKKNVWVKVTDRNGCTAADTISITYFDVPKVNLGRDTSFCKGPSIKLTANTDLTNKYLWKLLPKGTTLSTSNTLTTDSSGIYMVLVTNTSKCTATDTIKIVVNKNPVKPKINIVGSTSLCKGDSVRLDGPGSYTVYNWSNGIKVQSVTLKTTASLNLKVTDANGCTSPVSDTAKVVVHNLPSAPVIQFTGSSTFCSGDSLTLNATPGYAQYVWQDGIGKANRVVKKATLYSVYVIDNYGCRSTVSNSVYVDVLSGPSKPAILVKGSTSFCDGLSATLYLASSYPAYVWTDSIKKSENIITKGGKYGVKVKGNNGCFSPWSDNTTITVNPIPPKPKVVMGTSDSLKSNTVAGRYKWYRNAIEFGDTTLSIYSIKSGYFQVQIADKGCWSLLSDSLYFKNLEIRESLNEASKLVIIPNPVHSEAIIIILKNQNGSGNVFLSINDIQGKKALETETNYPALSRGISVNMDTLKKGIYFIKIHSSQFLYSGRLEKL